MTHIHGGNIYQYKEAADFSANINFHGMPQSVKEAAHAAIDRSIHYPEPDSRSLKAVLAEREGVPESAIICGNGAAELMFALAIAKRPKKAVLAQPCFFEYEQALTAVGCTLVHVPLKKEDGFQVGMAFAEQIPEDADLVILGNPNNPTGRTARPELLREIVRKCTENSVKLVVDECFNDFLTDAERHTRKDLLESNPGLIILRAYTKMYAVPGVRFGWCMTADAALIEKLYHAGQPWNVSVIAQACAAAAANEPAWAIETAKRIAEERRFLSDGLAACGLTVFPGEANFLLFRSNDTGLHKKLAEHGIMIRNCDNYRGLSAGYYRVAVKTREASKCLLNAIKLIMENG